ncbi:MAG: SMP-30/gluconolactonase/LRE family protein [Longimicrobiales bacterium]
MKAVQKATVCSALGVCGALALGCGGSQHPAPIPPQLVSTVSGFSEPEAVRYDPDQDVFFVANFNGSGDEADNNGFISRVRPDGSIERLQFIRGGRAGVTLHAPRGMAITGDTLWVADVDAVRGFDRRTGTTLVVIDFTAFEPGFLNDLAPGPDGALYVTDTGRNRIYRIADGAAEIALEDSTLDGPNGITWDAAEERFVVAPFGGQRMLRGWRPGRMTSEWVAVLPGARLDGVEVLGDSTILVASQADSALHLVRNGIGTRIIRTAGRPADIGVDTRRNRVAVPFIALDRVDIWTLPRR